jgi:hypothetical protein
VHHGTRNQQGETGGRLASHSRSVRNSGANSITEPGGDGISNCSSFVSVARKA